MADSYIDDDIATIIRDNGSKWELYWGDVVHRFPDQDVPETTIVVNGNNRRIPGRLRVATQDREGNLVLGFLSAKVKLRADSVFRLSMIDVQQGDGMIIETPSGKVIIIDGGDNKLFARHAAARYPATTAAKPKEVEAVIITHGDADHFEGLTELKKSESDTRPGKAIFVAPKRVYHNGIVKLAEKRPGAPDRKDIEMLGATMKATDGETYLTQFVDDPRAIPATDRNGPFNRWCDTLDHWDARAQQKFGQPMLLKRIDQKSDTATLFDFLAAENIGIELFGPIIEQVDGVEAMPYLRDTPEDARLMLGVQPGTKRGSYSTSHTINGHSINMRLTYKNVRFLFTGDMNQESMERVHKALPNANFTSEILKAPHHGAADFDFKFLQAASPVVSLISSGDEPGKEYIHPRATLMAALGQASRGMPAIIFNTELAAFFAYRGPSIDEAPTTTQEARYEGFERLNFGIIHIRTDGKRVLAFTHSGRSGMNEAYRFDVAADGSIAFSAKVTKQSAPKF